MKNNLLAICLALCALMLANRVSAQMGDTIIHLDDNIICACPPEFKDEFKMTAKQLVSEMNFYITSMTKKEARDSRGELHPTMEERKYFRKSALACFINNGDSIVIDGIKTSPAMVETSMVTHGGTIMYNTRPVKDYFTRLIRLIAAGRYTEFVVTSVMVRYIVDPNTGEKVPRLGDIKVREIHK